MIDTNEISVVVQGPVLREQDRPTGHANQTQEVLRSIRGVLPQAKIILSTWEGVDISGLSFDLVIFSRDPGSTGPREKSTSANIVRQIVSSKRGLEVVQTRYALKLRTDTLLTSAKFTDIWEIYSQGLLRNRCFKRRILVSATFTPCPRYCPSPYWVSDFFAFGLTEDVQYLWDIPSPTLAKMQDDEAYRTQRIESGTKITPPTNAEQKLILSMASKAGIHEKVATVTSINPFCLIRSEIFIASHFIPVDPLEAGFELPERFRQFNNHHTYRRDHKSTLFRSKSRFLTANALFQGFIWICYACLKGLSGRIHRYIFNKRS
jgi:hypothetical protein